MPIVVRRRHLHNRIAELEKSLGIAPTEAVQPSRLSKVFGRREAPPPAVAVDGPTVAKKAVAIALRPQLLGDLQPIERAQVEPLAKALQYASGWSDRSATPIGAREMRPVSAAVMARRAAEQLAPTSSVTPLDIALAMQAQGIDWALPFAPGRPLQPYYGFNRRPRQFDYQVGRNTTTTTRPDRIPFRTLLELWKSYDVAQICYRYSANSLRSMRPRFLAMDGYEKNPVKEIEEAKRRMRRPDGKRLFRNWLAMNQRNVWIFDSAPIYRQRDRAGRVKRLLNFSAMTLAPMLDYFGDIPDPPAPAFQQFITGIPWDSLDWDEVIYEPFWPETDSPYGTPPLETVLINANTDIRLQLYFLDFFTKGTVPEALAIAPEEMTSADDLADFQEQWTSETYATQAKRWGLKWLPHGTELEFYKPTSFDPELAEYVMRRTVAAHLLTPQNLGILEDVNRACYSDDTETLTENGWKRYDEVLGGERIATFNPSTKALEFHVPEKLYVYPYEGEMVHFSSRGVDCLVTPDHKMWVGRRSEESSARSTVVMSGLDDAIAARQGGRRNASGWSISAVCRRLGIDRACWVKAARGEAVRPKTAEAIRALLPEVVCSPSIPDRPVWYKAEAQELEALGDFWFADHSVWEGGEEVDSFELPAVESRAWRRPGRHVSMDSWLEFLGYVVSEGCIFGDGCGRYPVSLSQNERANPEKVRTIQACIDELPVAFNRYTDSGGTVRWQVCDKALWMWLRSNVGHYSEDKRLPDLWRALGKRQLSILFEALMLGDGSSDPKPGATNRTYFTKSSGLADDVQELALRLGYRTQRTTRLSGAVYRVHVSRPPGLGHELRWSRNARRVAYKGTVWCFHVPPNHLFLTRRNGKVTVAGNTSDTQVDQEFRVSTLPVTGYYEDLIDSILQETWTLPVQMRFETGREKEDRLTDVKAWAMGIEFGMVSPTEGREKLFGLPTNPEERIGRGYFDPRIGFVPAAHLQAVSGNIDPLTAAPKPGSVTPIPYQLPGGGTPVPAEGPQGRSATEDEDGGARPKGTPAKSYPRPLLAAPVAAKSAPPLDEDVQARASSSPIVAEGYGRFGQPSGASGSLGVGATGAPELLDEADDLRKWHRQSRRRVADGKPPRLFASSSIRHPISDRVWKALEGARTREVVDAAFKQAGPIAGGLVVQAEDTGRVLLIQRTPDHHDAGEAYCRWEFPGGKLTGDNPWTGSRREWEEETGAELPHTARHVGNWTSPDGVYVGFVLAIPRESDVRLAPQPEEVSEARWWAKDDLQDPAVREKVTETLTRVTPLLKGWTSTPRDRGGRWSTHHRVRLEQFHRHTDHIVAHYAPELAQAMAARVNRDAVLKVARDAYRSANVVEKATPSTRPTPTKIATAAAAAAGTAGVAGAGAGAAGAAASGASASALAAAIVQQLLGGAVVTSGAALVAILSALYADAYLQGAHEAAGAANGSMPPWTTAAAIPDEYWSAPTPQSGTARAIQSVAGGGLARLLADADVTIKGVTHTQLERIGDAIAQGIEHGFPIADVESEIASIIDTAARANMIAEDQYARAMGAGQMDVYRLNGVPELEWLHVEGACPRCMLNVAASPQPTVNPQWPSGGLPVHPRERCAVAPYFGSLLGGPT